MCILFLLKHYLLTICTLICARFKPVYIYVYLFYMAFCNNIWDVAWDTLTGHSYLKYSSLVDVYMEWPSSSSSSWWSRKAAKHTHT